MIYRAKFDPETGSILSVAFTTIEADLDEIMPLGLDTIAVPDDSVAERFRVENGELVPIAPAIDRTRALRQVERMAEIARERFISPRTAAAGIYAAKESEARAWLAAGEPEDLADWTLIAAEVGLTAPDAWQLVQLWLGLGAIWRQAAGAIEAARLAGKAAVADAETVEAVETALVALQGTLESI